MDKVLRRRRVNEVGNDKVGKRREKGEEDGVKVEIGAKGGREKQTREEP